jgi:hypothetical protein
MKLSKERPWIGTSKGGIEGDLNIGGEELSKMSH